MSAIWCFLVQHQQFNHFTKIVDSGGFFPLEVFACKLRMRFFPSISMKNLFIFLALNEICSR